MGLIPSWGRSPGEGNGNPLQYSCQGNPMDKGARWAHKGPRGCKESNKTEHSCTHRHIYLFWDKRASPTEGTLILSWEGLCFFQEIENYEHNVGKDGRRWEPDYQRPFTSCMHHCYKAWKNVCLIFGNLVPIYTFDTFQVLIKEV